MNKKVSIITVCYNSERTIERTILSVLHQTYTNIEYIIVDGASSDKTLQIVEKYKECFGERLVLISESDNGIYDAMNKGIRAASGNVIGIINSDDFYEKNAVEKAVEAISNKSNCIVYGMMRVLKDGIEESVILNNHKFLKEKMICHPSCFVTKDVYTAHGMYDTSFKSAADYDFMLRMYYDKYVDFFPIYSCLANYSVGGISCSLVGDMETLTIQYNRGFITKKKYLIEKLKFKIKELL